MAEILPRRERYAAALSGPLDPAELRLLVRYRWLLEEWRVALFAQEPGVKAGAGLRQIDDAWREFVASRRAEPRVSGAQKDTGATSRGRERNG